MSTDAERQEKLLNAKKKLKSYRARQAQKASQSVASSASSTTNKRSSLILSSPSGPSSSSSSSHARRPSAHRRSISRSSVFGPPSATPAAQKRDSRRLSWNAQNLVAAQLAKAEERERERERRGSEASVDTASTTTPAPTPQPAFGRATPTQPTEGRHGRRHSRTQSISVSHRAGSFSLPTQSALALPQVGLGLNAPVNGNGNGATVSPRSTSPNPAVGLGSKRNSTSAVSSWTFPRSNVVTSPSPAPAPTTPASARRLSRPQSLSFQFPSPSDSTTSTSAAGHARRPSRHARRTSVSTRRESMEIMSGLHLPSSLPHLSTSNNDSDVSDDDSRSKRRSEALNALEGRLRLPTSTIDIDSASDADSPTINGSRSPSTVTGSPAQGAVSPNTNVNANVGGGAMSNVQKRASWGPGSVLGQAAKGAMDLGILEEEDEEDLMSSGVGGGGLSSGKPSLDLGSRRSSKRKSGGAGPGRPTSLFLAKSSKRQSWGAGAGVAMRNGVGKGTMVAEQGTLEPRSPITPATSIFAAPPSESKEPPPGIGYATRSLNHIALPTSNSNSNSNSNSVDNSATSPPPAANTSLPLSASASSKGLRSLTLANLSASASSSGASQPGTPGSEQTSYNFGGSGSGQASQVVSPTAAEEKKARRRSSALGMGIGTGMSELGYGLPSSAGLGGGVGRKGSLGKRSSISYRNSSLSLSGSGPAAADGQSTLRASQRRNLSSGRASTSGTGTGRGSSAGMRSGSSLASWGMSVAGHEGETFAEGDESEEINFGDLVIGDESFDAGFGRRSTRSNTSTNATDDPLLISMLRTEIEQLRCDAADREDRAADEVKGLYDRSRELERELDDVRGLAREHAAVLSAAHAKATEAERSRDAAVEEVDQWRGRVRGLEGALERERVRGEEERRELAELRERVWAAQRVERELEEWRARAEKAERELLALRNQPRVEVVRAPPPRSLQLGSRSDDGHNTDVSSTRLSSPASGQSSFSFSHSASSSGATSVLGSCHGHGGNMSSTDVSVPIVLAGTSLQTLAEENEEDECAVPASVSSHSTSESDCNGPPTPAHLSGVNVMIKVGGAGEQVVAVEDVDEEEDEEEEQQQSHRRTGSFVRAWTFPHGTVQLVKPLKTRKRKSNKSPAPTGMMSLYVADDEAAISDADEEDDDHTFFQLSRRRKLPPLPVNPASLELPPFFLGGLQFEEPPSTAPSSFGMVMDPLFQQQQQHAKRGGSLSVRPHAPPPSRSARYGNISTSSSSISSISSQGAADLSSSTSSPSGGSRLSLQNMASLFTSYVAGAAQPPLPSAPPSKFSSSSSTPTLGRAQQDSPAGVREKSSASSAVNVAGRNTPSSGGKRFVDPSAVAPPRASPNRKLDFTRIVGTKERVIYL